MTSVMTRLVILEARSPSLVRWTMGAEGVLYVGQRVSSGGDFGTVRYVGPVPPTKGEWVGIEWDDPSRGKHNGTKNGVVYFKCDHENGGSFVRPHKISAGLSMAEALIDRYASYSLEDPAMRDEGMYLEGPGTLQKTKVETVGMEKVQKVFKNLKGLKVVGLRMENISHAGEEDFLETQAPNIQILDLSKNLFHEWVSIAKICKQLKFLQQLNLTENRMQIPRCPNEFCGSFSSLRTIILNGCQLAWNDVESCLEMWPQIEELHLDNNCISEITPPSEKKFIELRMINLTGNPINNWKNVSSLGKLPKLQKMILTQCGLSEAKIEPTDFVQLAGITLSSNKFESEEIFNQLNNLRSLKELRISNNPVLAEETAETMREVIIAKIAGLNMLNRTKVDAIERQGAEMDYMKKHGQYWRKSGGHQDPIKNKPSEEFMRDHPRYLELINTHGALEDYQFLVKSTALKSSLLEVTIVIPGAPDVKPMTKKLPKSMTVGALKVLISRVYKIPIKEQRLEYVNHLNEEHVIQMDKDSETLYYISMETGDTIRVNPKYSDERGWSINFYSRMKN